jgi:SAM-dependent methyltransferase
MNMKNRNTINNETVQRYIERYNKFGISKETLGWPKGKQNLRYHALLREIPLGINSITDIGCGFGDGIDIIKDKYPCGKIIGIDLVTEFVDVCRDRYPELEFLTGDYMDILTKTDAVVASGVFNHLSETNYSDIENLIKKCKSLGVGYLAFDVLSDNVDFKTNSNHYSDPKVIIEILVKYSRRYLISHLEQPFEFSVFVDFNDTFDSSTSTYIVE